MKDYLIFKCDTCHELFKCIGKCVKEGKDVTDCVCDPCYTGDYMPECIITNPTKKEIVLYYLLKYLIIVEKEQVIFVIVGNIVIGEE